MDQKRKEVSVSSSNSTGGVLEGGRLSDYEEKPKRAKIESKRAKLMRKPKMAKIEPKRGSVGFYNIGGKRVMVELALMDARGLARTRS